MVEHAKILLVEDHAPDYKIISGLLRKEFAGAVDIKHVTTLREAKSAVLAHRPDVILLDLTLPDSSGVATLAELHALSPTVPIVVVSGDKSQEVALNASMLGITFVSKERMTSLPQTVVSSVLMSSLNDQRTKKIWERIDATVEVITGLANRIEKVEPELRKVSALMVGDPDNSDPNQFTVLSEVNEWKKFRKMMYRAVAAGAGVIALHFLQQVLAWGGS